MDSGVIQVIPNNSIWLPNGSDSEGMITGVKLVGVDNRLSGL